MIRANRSWGGESEDRQGIFCEHLPQVSQTFYPAPSRPLPYARGLELICDCQQDDIVWVHSEIRIELQCTVHGDLIATWICDTPCVYACGYEGRTDHLYTCRIGR